MNFDIDSLNKIHKSFQDNILSAEQTSSVTKSLVAIYENLFEVTLKDAEKFHQYEVVRRGRRNLSLISSTAQSRSIGESEKILRSQATVFLVSSFETFLKDLFCHLVEHNFNKVIDSDAFPDELKFKKSAIKEISTENLQKSIGNIIITTSNKDITFQDLGSTIRTFRNLLNFDLENVLTQEDLDGLVRIHALRHVIVHKNSIIDDYYLTQVRSTRYKTDFKIDDKIEISVELYNYNQKILSGIANKIIEKVITNAE